MKELVLAVALAVTLAFAFLGGCGGATSESATVGQLLYEGFTPAQAEYGVSTTGL